MAAVFARVKSRPDLGQTITTCVCDASYPAGGYPVTARDLGLISAPDFVTCFVQSAQGLLAMYDVTAAKIKLFVSGTTDSVLNEAGTNDVSTAVIVRICATGAPQL